MTTDSLLRFVSANGSFGFAAITGFTATAGFVLGTGDGAALTDDAPESKEATQYEQR